MKKIYFYAGLVLAAFQSQLVLAQQISFESFALSGTETFWDGSDYSGVHLDGIFTSSFVESEFKFLTIYDTTFSAQWGYWSEGWAFSNLTPNNVSGLPGTYQSYAGGAADGSVFALGKRGSEIFINPDINQAIKINSINITNNAYAALSMLNGDFFAKQFGSSLDANGEDDGTNGEDWFLLEIVGHQLDGTTDTIDFYLADYRFADDADDYIVQDWVTVDISALGYISKLEFLLSSSDVGMFGMNTPGFFALDHIQYSITSTATVTEVSHLMDMTLYPNPTSGIINIATPELMSAIEVFDLTGKRVYSNSVSSSFEMLDLSYLPVGVYHIKTTTAEGQVVKKLIKH
jgi:hypothetical protein